MRYKYGFLLCVMLSACQVQTENSSSMDASVYPPGAGTVSGTPAFMEANQVIQTNCGSCHAYGSMNEAQLVAAGLVVAGSPTSSPLYYRIRGSSGGGNKNMPPSSTLSSSDLNLILVWISGI